MSKKSKTGVFRPEGRLKIVAYPSPGGARQYRLDQIAKYINLNEDNAVMVVSPAPMHDDALSIADVIVLQQTVDPEKIAWAWAYAKEQGKLLVAEIDDYIDVPRSHPLYKKHQELKAPVWTRRLLEVADIVTVTTQSLADVVREYNQNVFVMKNCLDMDNWGYPAIENTSDEIRFGWHGSATHREDLRMVKSAIMELLEKYPKMRFIYAGDGWLWRTGFFEKHPRTEYIESVQVEEWPARLRSLRLDIAIVPLINDKFNRGKSNLKWLENSIYKTPSVLSPVVYSETVKDGVTGLIAKTPKDFIKLVSKLVDDKDLRKKIGENAFKEVKANYDIRDHYKEWLDLYAEKLQRKDRLEFISN